MFSKAITSDSTLTAMLQGGTPSFSLLTVRGANASVPWMKCWSSIIAKFSSSCIKGNSGRPVYVQVQKTPLKFLSPICDTSLDID